MANLSRHLIVFGYLPLMLVGVMGLGVAAIGRGASYLTVAGLLVLAVALSFVAEWCAPYRSEWNLDRGDRRRDAIHALVNESLHLVTLALMPILGSFLVLTSVWPYEWPFVAQVAAALLVLDFGVTLCHWASHKINWLWRFHSVHHSVERMYGFNGLMKHPVHQSLETACGSLPLLALGLPPEVALAVVYCASVQLLLQHSNVDYAVGPLRYALALNQTHRFHHLSDPREGDVNFGLVTHLADHLLGTFSFDHTRPFSSQNLGIEGEPDYPRTYLAQIVRPFGFRIDETAGAQRVRS